MSEAGPAPPDEPRPRRPVPRLALIAAALGALAAALCAGG